VGVDPVIAGKPARPLMDDAIQATGGRRPLVVGDRLDTDIAGAHAVGADSLVVLSGVSTAATILAAAPVERATYLAAHLGEALRPADELRIGPVEGWSVDAGEQLTLEFTGAGQPDRFAALRALCAVWWAHGGGAASVRPIGAAATDVVEQLRLA
jgi:glycerol 3-phosphatase-2